METQTESTQETVTRGLTGIIVEYIAKVSSKYHGNEFTSSQLSKAVMRELNLTRTRFPIIHRITKTLLKAWERQGFCAHITRTKYAHCRKTKDVYRFHEKGLGEIKKKAIEETLETIKEGRTKDSSIMRTRESIIKDKIDELLDAVAVRPQLEEENGM